MNDEVALERGVRAVAALGPALRGLEECTAEREAAARAAARGYFKPDEERPVLAWFARYLTVRAALLEVIDELRPVAFGELRVHDEAMQLRCFAVAYTAACLLVRAGRFLVDEFAADKLVQRKLNEGCAELRMPRKQYTAIYRSLTHPANAWQLYRAMDFADRRAASIHALSNDATLAPVIDELRIADESLRIGVRRYLKARLRYRWHSWRRRRASAVEQALFGVAEAFGRVIAEIRRPWHVSRVHDEVRGQVDTIVRPGDVFVTRHEHALTNLFLPGYWPHAALYLGPCSGISALGLSVDDERRCRWCEPRRVLEAQKDGVRFRPMSETLHVDAFAVIRPRLTAAELADGLSRAITHEGKLYNFDFNFFTSDRLVCTEVVYRAYDGVAAMDFRLTRRAGRVTLSAEDLLDMALDGRGFEPVAVFGALGCEERLAVGSDAAPALARSYRAASASGSE